MFHTDRRTFLAACISALPLGLSSKLQFLAGSEPKSLSGIEDFAFLHFSDSHLDPRHEGQPFNIEARSLRTLMWLGSETSKPIEQAPYQVTADKPAFAVHTGDVFEYSESDHIWDDWEKATADFKCPIYPVPGNHDNTWGEINQVLTEKYGGENYSFDHGGCHFICINSAGLLEPMPSLDRATLNWLAEDLKNTPEEVPLFMALHHPLYALADYASEFDKLRLWDIVRDRQIALIMDGHWHIVQCNKWQHFDRINGGATFGPHTGYNSITIEDGVLRVMFQYEHEAPEGDPIVPLLEKSLATRPQAPAVAIEVDSEDSANGQVAISAAGIPDSASAEVWADNDASQAQPLRADAGTHRTSLDVGGLVPGWHYVTVRVKETSGQETTHGKAFCVKGTNDSTPDVRELQLPAGVKTRPVAYKDWMLIGNTLGEVIALSHDLQQQWQFDTGSQVVHSVTVNDDRVLVGDISGKLRMLSAEDGQQVWECQFPRAIYAAAVCDDQHAYVGDSHGGMHAVNLADGEVVWSTRPAIHAIEAQATLIDDEILIGAWDAFIYSLDAATGETRWKSRCPSGHLQNPARYYAAADCPLVVLGNKIFACDRGYLLGVYSRAGEFERRVAQNVSAIALDSSGEHLLGKGLRDQLFKFNRRGRRVWRVPTTAGRIVTAPVEHEGRIAVLSDKGIVSLHDAEDGRFLTSYSVSPSLYCLSGLGLDSVGGLMTADMDGKLTRLVMA